jgi:hypothetical protein
MMCCKQVNCSPYLKLFLCTVYAPVCSLATQEPIPPCRSLCVEARSGCQTLMDRFGFSWPENLDCARFPVDGLCYPMVEETSPSYDHQTSPIPSPVVLGMVFSCGPCCPRNSQIISCYYFIYYCLPIGRHYHFRVRQPSWIY